MEAENQQLRLELITAHGEAQTLLDERDKYRKALEKIIELSEAPQPDIPAIARKTLEDNDG